MSGAHALRRVALDFELEGAPVLIPDSSLLADCVTGFPFNISHVLIEYAQVRKPSDSLTYITDVSGEQASDRPTNLMTDQPTD